ncbi:hypothetical protein [Xanthomonas campestris]|uniref:hypothetical protein n=1 Tax=Xanthomonas campestris TaxID=339 RepID=UPI00137B560E|nr:hypothetical protein [Xanthomonas campestris]
MRNALYKQATQKTRQVLDDAVLTQCRHAKALARWSSKISHITPQELHWRARISMAQAYGSAFGVGSERICTNV